MQHSRKAERDLLRDRQRKVMGARKKSKTRRKSKAEKARRKALEHLSEQQARELVIGLIDQGKPKEAIQSLHQISFSDSPGFNVLKAWAYGLRARQLEEKGLVQEAESVLNMLSRHLSLVSEISCEDLARVVRLAPLSYGIDLYEEHRKKHASCPMLESAMADELMLSGRWALVDKLSEGDPIRRDAAFVSQAVPDLDGGRWEEGLEKLAPLARKSPFAAWKWFAKAMAAAYARDEDTLQRSLRQLPEGFPLRATVRVLRKEGIKALDGVHRWVVGPQEDLAQKVVKAVRDRDVRLPILIAQFAKEIFPQNPDAAVRFISELVGLALLKKNADTKTVERLLPASVARPVLLRLQIFLGTLMDHGQHPFCLARQYLRLIDSEYPHIQDKKRVEAALYHTLLTMAMSSGMSYPGMLPYGDLECIRGWIDGDESIGTGDLFIATVEKVTRLAPDVHHYYLVLKELHNGRASLRGKKLLEQALLRMQNRFPEDPFSYLQLARLYLSRGAYRKSQKILEDAWKHAPYDPGVREQYVIGLLLAAVRSGRRRAYHLAWKDVDQAERLDVKSQLPLINGIKANLRFLEKGDLRSQVQALTALPEPEVRFRSLVYFHQSLRVTGGYGGLRACEEVAKAIRTGLDRELKKLNSSQLAEIVAPLPSDHSELVGEASIRKLFENLWPAILSRLNDQHVLSVYPLVLGEPGTNEVRWVKKDLRSRAHRQKENIFFRFFQAMVKYLEDPEVEGADPFFDLVEEAGEEDKRNLRDFCRRIAHHFDEPLFSALSSFNFNVLEEVPEWFLPDFDLDFEPDFDLDIEPDFESVPDFGKDAFEGGDLIESFAEEFNKLGDNRHVLQLFFEVFVGVAIEKRLEDELLREIGFILEAKAGRAVETLRTVYSGRSMRRRLSRQGRLILFPHE